MLDINLTEHFGTPYVSGPFEHVENKKTQHELTARIDSTLIGMLIKDIPANLILNECRFLKLEAHLTPPIYLIIGQINGF
jgi:hypothetical protein